MYSPRTTTITVCRNDTRSLFPVVGASACTDKPSLKSLISKPRILSSCVHTVQTDNVNPIAAEARQVYNVLSEVLDILDANDSGGF